MKRSDETFESTIPERVMLINGTETTKVGTLKSPRRDKEIYKNGNRFYYYSHLQGRLFPISKKDLGL